MYIRQKILSLSLFFFFGWEMMSDSGHEQPRSKKVSQEREGVKGCFQASCDCGQTEICLDEEIWEAESSLEISFNWAETVGKFSTHSIYMCHWLRVLPVPGMFWQSWVCWGHQKRRTAGGSLASAVNQLSLSVRGISDNLWAEFWQCWLRISLKIADWLHCRPQGGVPPAATNTRSWEKNVITIFPL